MPEKWLLLINKNVSRSREFRQSGNRWRNIQVGLVRPTDKLQILFTKPRKLSAK